MAGKSEAGSYASFIEGFVDKTPVEADVGPGRGQARGPVPNASGTRPGQQAAVTAPTVVGSNTVADPPAPVVVEYPDASSPPMMSRPVRTESAISETVTVSSSTADVSTFPGFQPDAARRALMRTQQAALGLPVEDGDGMSHVNAVAPDGVAPPGKPLIAVAVLRGAESSPGGHTSSPGMTFGDVDEYLAETAAKNDRRRVRMTASEEDGQVAADISAAMSAARSATAEAAGAVHSKPYAREGHPRMRFASPSSRSGVGKDRRGDGGKRAGQRRPTVQQPGMVLTGDANKIRSPSSLSHGSIRTDNVGDRTPLQPEDTEGQGTSITLAQGAISTEVVSSVAVPGVTKPGDPTAMTIAGVSHQRSKPRLGAHKVGPASALRSPTRTPESGARHQQRTASVLRGLRQRHEWQQHVSRRGTAGDPGLTSAHGNRNARVRRPSSADPRLRSHAPIGKSASVPAHLGAAGRAPGVPHNSKLTASASQAHHAYRGGHTGGETTDWSWRPHSAAARDGKIELLRSRGHCRELPPASGDDEPATDAAIRSPDVRPVTDADIHSMEPPERGLGGILKRLGEAPAPVPVRSSDRPSSSVMVTHIPDEFSMEIDIGPVYDADKSAVDATVGRSGAEYSGGTWRRVEFPQRLPTRSAREDALSLQRVLDQMLQRIDPVVATPVFSAEADPGSKLDSATPDSAVDPTVATPIAAKRGGSGSPAEPDGVEPVRRRRSIDVRLPVPTASDSVELDGAVTERSTANRSDGQQSVEQPTKEAKQGSQHIPSADTLRQALLRIKREAKVYSIGLHELARQVAGHCHEQGQLMANMVHRLMMLLQGLPPLFSAALEGQRRQIAELLHRATAAEAEASATPTGRMLHTLRDIENSGPDMSATMKEVMEAWSTQVGAGSRYAGAAQEGIDTKLFEAEVVDVHGFFAALEQSVRKTVEAEQAKTRQDMQEQVDDLTESVAQANKANMALAEEREAMQEELRQLSDELERTNFIESELSKTKQQLAEAQRASAALNLQIQKMRRPSFQSVGSYSSEDSITESDTARLRESAEKAKESSTDPSPPATVKGSVTTSAAEETEGSRGGDDGSRVDDEGKGEEDDAEQAFAILAKQGSSHSFGFSGGQVQLTPNAREQVLAVDTTPADGQASVPSATADSTSTRHRRRVMRVEQERDALREEVARLQRQLQLQQRRDSYGVSGESDAESTVSISQSSVVERIDSNQSLFAAGTAASKKFGVLKRVGTAVAQSATMNSIMTDIQDTAEASGGFSPEKHSRPKPSSGKKAASFEEAPAGSVVASGAAILPDGSAGPAQPVDEEHRGGGARRTVGPYPHGILGGIGSTGAVGIDVASAGGAGVFGVDDSGQALPDVPSAFLTSAFGRMVGWSSEKAEAAVRARVTRKPRRGSTPQRHGVQVELDLEDKPLVALRVTIEELYARKACDDEANDLLRQPRRSLHCVVYEWLIERFGSREVAVAEGCQFIASIERYRKSDVAVDNFARFLEGSYSVRQLSLFLWLRVSVDEAPFGISYTSPHPSFDIDPDWLCTFRAGLVVRAVSRALQFEGPPPAEASPRKGKGKGKSKGARAADADALVAEAASGVAKPVTSGVGPDGFVPYRRVTGFPDGVAGAGVESASNAIMAQLMAVSELTPSEEDDIAEAGGVDPISRGLERRVVAGKVIEGDLADAVSGSHRLPRPVFLRFMAEEYERQRLRRWQRVWEDWQTVGGAGHKETKSRKTKGRSKAAAAAAATGDGAPPLPRPAFELVLRSLDPDIDQHAIDRVYAACALHSTTPAGIEWTAFAFIATQLQLLDDNFAALPRLTDEYTLSRAAITDVFDRSEELLSASEAAVAQLVTHEPNSALVQWILELRNAARAAVRSTEHCSHAVHALREFISAAWQLAAHRACGVSAVFTAALDVEALPRIVNSDALRFATQSLKSLSKLAMMEDGRAATESGGTDE